MCVPGTLFPSKFKSPRCWDVGSFSLEILVLKGVLGKKKIAHDLEGRARGNICVASWDSSLSHFTVLFLFFFFWCEIDLGPQSLKLWE